MPFSKKPLELRPDNVCDPVEWPLLDAGAPEAAGVLGKSMGRFFPGRGPIEKRNEALYTWIVQRARNGVWPYGLCMLSPANTRTRVRHPAGTVVDGINLTAVDYLGLSQDPRLKEAAIRAIHDYGFHTPSSGPLMGNTPASRKLEKHLAKALRREDVFVCPTGWAAGFAAVSGIVRQDDFVVMDELAHQCLQQGAYGSTPNVSTFPHLDNDALEQKLRAIREDNAQSAILVITEGLFSMDGDAPDLRTLTEVCRRYGALVLIDVAHDLGATGPNGTGTVGAQGLLQDVDVVVGSFSKCFGTNGGFISARSESVRWAQLCFGGPYTYSTAMSAVQAEVASAALEIVTSAEGDMLRQQLRERVHHTRHGAVERGLGVLGSPSPIVPILIGKETHSRVAGMLSFQKGLIATCLEFPVVQRGAARYRLSMSPRLTTADIDTALDIIVESISEARAMVDAPEVPAAVAQ